MTKHPTTPTPGQTAKNRIMSEGLKNAADGIIQGFTLGTGSALAHKAVGAIFVSTMTDVSTGTHNDSSTKSLLMKEYMTCMKENNDYESCKKFLEAFNNMDVQRSESTRL